MNDITVEPIWYLTFDLHPTENPHRPLGYVNYAHANHAPYYRGIRIDCISPLNHHGKKWGVFAKGVMHDGTRHYS